MDTESSFDGEEEPQGRSLRTTRRAPQQFVAGQPKSSGPEASSHLYSQVVNGRASLQAVVDDWIESYKTDRDLALLEMIKFFISSSGCKGTITPQMYATMEHAELIRKMTEEFDEESGDYPLIMPGPMWKKYRSNFCDFVVMLVKQCQYSIIYDQYMMDNVISFLTGLTDSQVRAFRHTSTLASMKLMTALVDVALNLNVQLDNTCRQYESERAKANKSNRSGESRLETLMSRRSELEENVGEIKNMLQYIFKGVFVHRYRDILQDIRCICMIELGEWMKKYPSHFLDDSYLKYLGWTLYDKIGEVRLTCLRSLQPLYAAEDLSQRLELFTNRFKDRIVMMTVDKEFDVAVQAVKLVRCILVFNEGILTDRDCENVYELVYSTHRQVSQAAAEFLNEKLFKYKGEEEPPEVRTKHGKRRSMNTPFVRDLIQFFIESELHEHAAYLVDSMWDVNEMMKDWECMTDLLIEEPGKDEPALDSTQESSLIEIMCCAVKQAATGETPVGRGPTRKILSAKEQKTVNDDRHKLSEHFIIALPRLLTKYQNDSDKVKNLLAIPNHFELDTYSTRRLDKQLDDLLRILRDIVEKSNEHEVLSACAKVFEHLRQENYAIHTKVDVATSSLLDSLAEKFHTAFHEFFEEATDPGEDEIFSLTSSLRRLHAFYACHDFSHLNLWEGKMYYLVHCSEDPSRRGAEMVSDDIVKLALGCCSYELLWGLYKVEAHPNTENAIKELRQRQLFFMKSCKYLMEHPSDKIREDAYLIMCDLLICFSKQLGERAPRLRHLVYDTDEDLQTKLRKFVEQFVFIEEDEEGLDENLKIEELHKRRNLLASFAKLIVYNVIPIRCAMQMFMNYMKFYNDYGDIIKATLSKAREINKVTCARTLCFALQTLFSDVLQSQGGRVDPKSTEFGFIRDLARRFALSFGLDQTKNRDAVARLHIEGQMFAVNRTAVNVAMDPHEPPPNFAFLEILAEFSAKLMKQDKKTVVSHLDKLIAENVMTQQVTDEWHALGVYRQSLLHGEEIEKTLAPMTKYASKKGGPAKRPAVPGFNFGAAIPTTSSAGGGKRGRFASGGTTPVHEMHEESSMQAPDLTLNDNTLQAESTLGHSTMQLPSNLGTPNLGTPALSSTMMQERYGRGPPKHRAGKNMAVMAKHAEEEDRESIASEQDSDDDDDGSDYEG